jgi:DNA-binding SARP family transcriptional activator/Tfp pilus assembly protein PilF
MTTTGLIVDFRILGPVGMWAGGEQRDLGGLKERSVLAILLLTPGVPVSADVLSDRIWDARPPPKARQDLSAYVSRIRKILRNAAGDEGFLVTRADGYVIDIDPGSVDLHVFRRLRRQARAMADSGEAEQAILLLREADECWRGTAFAGLPGTWMATMRHGLQEERREALVQRAGLELELGRHAELVPELAGLLGQYQLDEAVLACYLRALYLSGRSADALDAYARVRRRMIDELGVEPGHALASLQQQILRRDPQLAVVAPALSRSGRPKLETLPPQAGQFVGRTRETSILVSESRQAEGQTAVVVIEGMAGVGKTALAVHVARAVSDEFPDGHLYINFRAHDPVRTPITAADALPGLLRMIGVPGKRIPGAFPERGAAWRAEMTSRQLVVVLDDVLDAEQIRPLLPRSCRCFFLVTSRSQIHDLPGARSLVLGVLHGSDALAMFASIASSVIPGEEHATAEVVRLCEYLPLAIQLAASRLLQEDSLSVTDLALELSNAQHTARPADAVHLGMATAFDLSYRGLTTTQQRSFRRAGMHPGPDITPHAAVALDDAGLTDEKDSIAALSAHHLLEPIGAGRYRFHDLLRVYAISCSLRDDPEPDRRRAIGRLLDYYLGAADHADRVLYPYRRRLSVPVMTVSAGMPHVETVEEGRIWLESERRNILPVARFARQHEWTRQCAGLGHVFAGFLENEAHWDDALALHEIALSACRDLDDPRWIAQALLELSRAHQNTGHYERAIRHADEATVVFRSLRDRQGEAEALDRLGTIHNYSARFLEALAFYQEARSAYQDAGDDRGVADTLDHEAKICWSLGRRAEAVAQLDEALARYRQAGDRRGEAKTLNNIGVMQRYLGLHRDAVQNYEESRRIFEEIGGRQSQALLKHNMGTVFQYKGEYDNALKCYRQALATYRDTNDLRNQAGVLNEIGSAYQEMGLYEEADAHHQKACAMAEEIGERYEQLVALRGIADSSRGMGSNADARDGYENILRIAREIGESYQEAKILDGMGHAVLRIQGREAARIYWRQALDIFQRLGVPEAESVRLTLHAYRTQDS